VSNSFQVIVGRPWDRPAQQCEDTLRARLRDRSALWLRREAGASQQEADAAADRIVADQLPPDRLGVPVVALNAEQLRGYLRQAREATR
jgi:hypothetical protein